MPRIFLSHSHRDNPAALALARWLELKGWDDYFLDISEHRGISPGERWQEALKTAADRCEAVIFLLSPAWRSSRWCLAELLLAQQLGKAIFGVLVETLPIESIPVEMTAQWQICDLVEGQDRLAYRVELDPVVAPTEVSFAGPGLQRLERGLRKAGLDPSTFPWPPERHPDRTPFHGLAALEIADAPIFFGREAAIVHGLDALRRLRHGAQERLFVIVGASGAGKSSFLRAGLLSRLQRDDRNFLTLPLLRPEQAAIEGSQGLLACLETAFRDLGAPRNRAEIRQTIERLWGFTGLLSDLQEAAWGRLADAEQPPTLVLPIDPGEELYGPEAGEQAVRLLELLRTVLAPIGQGRSPLAKEYQVPIVVVAIRSDSFGALQSDPRLRHVASHVFSLPPLAKESYKAIIEGPAARHTAAGHDLQVDPRLTERLLEDAEGADALPLLAFTLERLLREHGADGMLSLEDYEALGGIDGSIEAAIQDAFAHPHRAPVLPPDQETRERLLRTGFVPWLARIDPETEERKRRVAAWSDIPPAARPLLERLLEKRLLVRDRRRNAGGDEDVVVVEVAHEALLRRWPLLSSWLAEDAEALKAIDAARRSAAEWQRRGRREAWLVHGGERLAHVEALLASAALEQLLGTEGRSYLRACRDHEDTELRAEAEQRDRERAQRDRAMQAEQEAERERLRLAELEAEGARERIAAAKRLSRRTLAGAVVAVMLMIVSLALAWRAEDQQERAELTLGASDFTEALRRQREGDVGETAARLARAARLDPDNVSWRMALAQVLISQPWARPVAEMRLYEEPSQAVFSPDGHRLLLVAGDVARLWDVEAGVKIADLQHRNDVLEVRFSADGTRLLTGSRDRRVRVWNTADGQLLKETTFDGIVEDLAWVNGTSRVAAEIYSNDLHVWDVDSGRAVFEPSTQGSVWIAPNGRHAIVDDSTFTIWDLSKGRTLPVSGSGPWSGRGLSYSPDGEAAFFNTSEGFHRLDLDRGEVEQWTEARLNIAFGGTNSRRALLWHSGLVFAVTDHRRALGREVIQNKDGRIQQVELTGDGERLLYSIRRSGDRWADDYLRSIHIRGVQDGVEVAPEVERLASQEVRLCSNGERFLTELQGSVVIWDTATGEPLGSPLELNRSGSQVVMDEACSMAAVVSEQQVHLVSLRDGGRITAPLVRGALTHGFALSPDWIHLVTWTPQRFHLWDLRAGVARPEVRHREGVWGHLVSPDGGHSVWISDSGQLVLRDESSGRETQLRQYTDRPYYRGYLEALTFSEDGRRLVLEGWQDTVEIYDIEKATWGDASSLRTYREARRLSPDGTLWATWSERAARLNDAESGQRVGQLLRHRRQITDLAFSPDGSRVATTSEDGTARIWSVDGEPLSEPLRHERLASGALWSGDGRVLLTLGQQLVAFDGDSADYEIREIRTWDGQRGTPLGPAKFFESTLDIVRVNRSGDRVLTVLERQVQVFDPRTWQPIGRPLDHAAVVTAAAFSPDGRRLVTASGARLHVWDASQAVAIGQPLTYGGDIQDARFLLDGQRLLASGDAGSWLWDFPRLEAADVPLMAELAEVLGGYRITEAGALEALDKPAYRLREIGRRLEEIPDREMSQGARLARWLLSDPATRAPSPLTPSTADAEQVAEGVVP